MVYYYYTFVSTLIFFRLDIEITVSKHKLKSSDWNIFPNRQKKINAIAFICPFINRFWLLGYCFIIIGTQYFYYCYWCIKKKRDGHYNWQIKMTESLVGVKQLKVQLKYGTLFFYINIAVVVVALWYYFNVLFEWNKVQKNLFTHWVSERMKKLTRLMD